MKTKKDFPNKNERLREKIIKIPDELYWEHKKWKKAFKDEFGIHFKNSPDELKFALTFIEELLESRMNSAYWEDRE